MKFKPRGETKHEAKQREEERTAKTLADIIRVTLPIPRLWTDVLCLSSSATEENSSDFVCIGIIASSDPLRLFYM